MQPQPESSPPTGAVFKKPRRIGGLAWVLIGVAVLFVTGFVMSALRQQRSADPRAVVKEVPSSHFGVNEFRNVKDVGVTFNEVYPPDSPADKAGLVGGDVITEFDGHPVKNEKEMMNLLRQTPVGKSVEVVYLRDAETKKARLTTISNEQVHQLEDAFESRAGGQGQLGFDDGQASEVPISESKISGVQLNVLSSSGPAKLAGLQERDIVIEFEGVPIRTLGELIARVRRSVPYSTVNIVVMRGAERLKIPVKMGKRG
jgi:S1-C subfamily serine protease